MPAFKELRRIGPAFEAYLQTIYGANAGKLPAAQRAELEQAYYGAIHWLLEMLAKQLEPGAEPTDNDVAVLEQIHREVQGYAMLRHASLTFNFRRGPKG